MSQIIARIWNENLNLKKEKHLWFERIMTVSEFKGEEKVDSWSTIVEAQKDGRDKVWTYDAKGVLMGFSESYFEHEFLKIFKDEGVIVAKEHYDANENLISKKMLDRDGSENETKYTFEDNLLVKIEERYEDELSIEVLKYENRKLIKILSVDEKGNELMRQRIIYDDNGRIQKTQTIQDGNVYKTVHYSYNVENQLILKEEDVIHRLTGEKMPPAVETYSYFENGIVKEKRSTDYVAENKEEKKFETITTYNEQGLEVKGIFIDYKSDEREISNYTYKLQKPIKVEYTQSHGFQIGAEKFNWNDDRKSVRTKLKNQHKEDDRIIEMAEFFGGDKSNNIEQRRDIYEDINNGNNSFFLSYDKDDKLSELEINSGFEVSVKGVLLKFENDINVYLKAFEGIDETFVELEKGNYFFEFLKLTIADFESMGGEGNGLSYFYAARNIEHLLEE